MSAPNQDAFERKYQAGRQAFERGRYRQSIEQLEAACQLQPRASRLGGEAQLWLVTAYQAAGQTQEAIALCESLQKHPFSTTRQQAKRLLEILKAPTLKRPKEWNVEIPDMTAVSESDPNSRYVPSKSASQKRDRPYQPDPIDPRETDTKDNGFIWIALAIVLLVLAGLWRF